MVRVHLNLKNTKRKNLNLNDFCGFGNVFGIVDGGGTYSSYIYFNSKVTIDKEILINIV